jgi:hypothetical protein
MQRTLGVTLAPEILPMSDIQAWLFPFLLDPSHILAFAEEDVAAPRLMAPAGQPAMVRQPAGQGTPVKRSCVHWIKSSSKVEAVTVIEP